jgi:hypothetical protein
VCQGKIFPVATLAAQSLQSGTSRILSSLRNDDHPANPNTVKLSDLRYGGAPSWPPTWPRWPGPGPAPGPDAGVLAAVRVRPGGDGVFVDRSHGADHQEGLLLWEGAPDATVVAARLGRALGRPIRDLAALEI